VNTVLVVEDNENIQKIIRVYLEFEGFRVVQAYDGEEGLEKFHGESPDLILLDISLPRLDGLAVCREVRRARATPVIIVSARDTAADREAGFAAGANDYVSKPFSPRELVNRVKGLLCLTA
jgi:DNA-binding response OmpR family regulator